MLTGWKTYLVSAASVIAGVVLINEGAVIPGVELILGGLGLGTLRAGVKKAEKAAEKGTKY